MRYYNYLNENQKEIDKFLKNNEIFDLAKKNMFLYRGTEKTILNHQIFNRRKDRKPKDLLKHLHDEFDISFNDKFKWYARSEGVFTTNERHNASDYGIPYIFIPIKPYKFIWSPKIDDLFSEIDNQCRYISYEERKILLYPDDYDDEDFIEIIDKVVNTYTDKNIQKAIKSGNEIMFNCDKYILFNEIYFKEKYL